MIKICALFLAFLIALPLAAHGVEIAAPEVELTNDEVFVSASLILDEKNLADVKNGISKEITFYLDLYRVWNAWPDEFIAGKKIQKTLKVDPVKKEYTAAATDGTTLVKKRFKDLDSMLTWTLAIKGLPLVYARELEPSNYYVRVTVESRIRSLPPVIGYLLFFVPEKEFKITRDSSVFSIGGLR